MITKAFVYKCSCESCSHQWTTKSDVIPKCCPKCHGVKWNHGAAPIIEKSLADRVRELDTDRRLSLFAHFETCCGQDSGNCICEPVEAETAQYPANGNKLSITELRALIEPIETLEPVPVDQWQGWTEPQQTYDDQTGEMRTYRRHVKSGRTKWIEAETYQSGV